MTILNRNNVQIWKKINPNVLARLFEDISLTFITRNCNFDETYLLKVLFRYFFAKFASMFIT